MHSTPVLQNLLHLVNSSVLFEKHHSLMVVSRALKVQGFRGTGRATHPTCISLRQLGIVCYPFFSPFLC
jgi:hypothetical protein